MKHILIKDTNLNGWEYGMLRSFERSIVEVTGAETMIIPDYRLPKNYMDHFGHSMNKAFMRKFFPKDKFVIEGDVAWYILMGPENYKLDLFSGWSANVKTKVLYLYDTLPQQYHTVEKIFSNNTWDICITSFNDSVSDLEKITGRKWFCIPQAADVSLFSGSDISKKTIHFSSYGRRLPLLHEVLLDFCKANNLYYDYTTHDGKHPTVDSVELYKQYAWHLNHSLFNISWPVEVTSPDRAGHLHPITCRWFEAAMSNCIIIGQEPANSAFADQLHNGLVQSINPSIDKKQIFKRLEDLWENREKLFENVQKIRSANNERWTWEKRVNSILELL